MSDNLRTRLYQEMDQWVLIDPHTHINPHSPAAGSLADILGYHYYTELAHSAGLARDQIETAGIEPRELVSRLVPLLESLENTVQYSWLIELAQAFFSWEDNRLTGDNWQALYDRASERMAEPKWAESVLKQSRLSAVFLTNEFDDPLDGFDTSVYIPCLRTDDLVFKLNHQEVRNRLERATNHALRDVQTLRSAIGELFQHFTSHGARACAISLPPDFEPAHVEKGEAESALASVLRDDGDAESARNKLSQFVFWTLAEHCAEFRLPFDLMIGVNRGVYQSGVFQGQDLYDSRVSLIQYGELFNSFPQVTFPISVLASVTNQELVSYAWIFPNVITHGHWWYSNTPTFIEHDLAARLEAVPQNKQIGYYSDMYKLEFALPKFGMYKRVLAKVLAERFVIDRGWSEERAMGLARRVLQTNVERVFLAQ